MILALTLSLPVLANAGNIPETPITKILNFQSGLELTDAQVKSLTLINNNIVNKMLQLNAQAERYRTEIDGLSGKWSELNNPKAKSAVKEYYSCQANLKTLEFEAMAQASTILSEQQIKHFHELTTIELIMIDMEKEMAVVY